MYPIYPKAQKRYKEKLIVDDDDTTPFFVFFFLVELWMDDLVLVSSSSHHPLSRAKRFHFALCCRQSQVPSV